jgi:hypothetical protein
MPFTSGFVVMGVARPSGKEPFMESFAGADLHKRVTQLAVQRLAAIVPVSSSQRSEARSQDLRKLPRGTKIDVEATVSWWWFIEKERELGHEVCQFRPIGFVLAITNLRERLTVGERSISKPAVSRQNREVSVDQMQMADRRLKASVSLVIRRFRERRFLFTCRIRTY